MEQQLVQMAQLQQMQIMQNMLNNVEERMGDKDEGKIDDEDEVDQHISEKSQQFKVQAKMDLPMYNEEIEVEKIGSQQD